MNHSEKVLFVEGTADDKNGDLRLGFGRLLSQKLFGKMPRIIMGNGISETADKYKNANGFKLKASLIDLDGKGDFVARGEYKEAKQTKMKYHNFKSSDNIYFMVQKMEAWFLSQPEVLRDYFQKDFKKIPFDHPSKIERPDDELRKFTQELKSKSYHKVRDGSRLLQKLNLSKLEATFEDVREMVEMLGN